jgi:hypothetical protein
MKPVTMTFLLSLLPACGGAAPDAGAPPPSGTTAAVTPAAPVAAPPPAEAVGPDGPSALAVPAIELSADPALIAQGKTVFDGKGCGACHKFGSKLVGPDLAGITTRRSPTWIARMIRYPEQMTKTDPVARDLFRSMMVQMTDQGVSDADLPAIVAYLHAEGAGASGG